MSSKKAHRNAKEQKILEQKQRVAAPQLAALREKSLRAKASKPFSHLHCRYCGQKTEDCSNTTKICANCGQNVAVCAEDRHQKGIFCRAATAAQALEAKGLVRSPADALMPMLDEIGVPYTMHPTKVVNWAGKGLLIQEEAWVPPEVIAIIQVERPLPERIRALRRLTAAS